MTLHDAREGYAQYKREIEKQRARALWFAVGLAVAGLAALAWVVLR